MGRFVIHGVLLEEPRRTTLKDGLDCISLLIEEKYQTAFKEVVSTFSVDFIGKSTNCVPTNIKLTGAPVVVMGTISSREYKGRYFNDLRGDQLSIITTKSFEEDSVPAQADVDEVKTPDLDALDLPDDDLPF